MPSITSISPYPVSDTNFTPERLAEALQHFISQGKKYAVEKLIATYGAPLNVPLPNGELPLHFAVKKNHLEVVKVLIEHGFDVESGLHISDLPAIDHAIQMGHREIAAFLISHKIGKTFEELKTTAPFYAAEVDLKLMDMSLQEATKIDPKVMSPFSVAAYEGDLDTIDALYKKNPNLIRAIDKSGRCPVHYAILGGSTATFKRIKELGIPLTLDIEGHYLLHYAAFAKSPEMVNAITEIDPRFVNLPNAKGHTPLHYAAMQQDLATFTALINKGADPKLQDKCYETPFSIFFAKSMQKDPLALSHGQILLFFTSLLSIASGNPLLKEWLSRDVLDTALFIGQTAGFGADFLTSFRLQDSAWKQVVGTLSFTLIHLLLPSANVKDSSNFKDSMLQDPVQHFAHLLLCAYQIGVTCIVAKGALDGLKNCWKHGNFRPIKAFSNSIVHTLNAGSSVYKLAYTVIIEAARFRMLAQKGYAYCTGNKQAEFDAKKQFDDIVHHKYGIAVDCPSHTEEQLAQMKTQSLGDRILRPDVDLKCDSHLDAIVQGIESGEGKLLFSPKKITLSEKNNKERVFTNLRFVFSDDHYKKTDKNFPYIAPLADLANNANLGTSTNPVLLKIIKASEILRFK